MPTYSKIIPDEEIIRRVSGKSKNVYLIGCAGCMNESLAFDNGLPIWTAHGSNKRFPAIEAECIRITKLLKQNGIQATYKVIPGGESALCILSHDKEHYPLDIKPEYDAVLVLACPSGFQDICNNTEVRTIILTEQIGSINYSFEEEEGTRRIIGGSKTAFAE